MEISGLQAKLDKLVHHKEKSAVQGAHLHAFIYFVTIHNLTESTITLLGRKWILVNEDGTTTVVEGDKIVGECPVLNPEDPFPTTVTTSPISRRKHEVPFMVSMIKAARYMCVWNLSAWKSRSILPLLPPPHEVY